MLRIVEDGQRVTLDDILRGPVDRTRHLACVAMVTRSGPELTVMPGLTTAVRPGDQILFCGTAASLRLLDATLNNEYVLRYLISGVDEPRGYVMQWLARKYGSQASPA